MKNIKKTLIASAIISVSWVGTIHAAQYFDIERQIAMPAKVNFNTPATATYTVKNNGKYSFVNGPQKIVLPTTDSKLTANECNTNGLPAGGSCQFTVTFTPESLASYDESKLRVCPFNNSPQCYSVNVPRISTVTAVSGRVDPALNANIPVGVAQNFNFAFKNNANVSVNGVSADYMSAGGAVSDVTNDCGGNLGAGETCNVKGKFTAVAPGVVNVKVNFSDDHDGQLPIVSTGNEATAIRITGEVSQALPDNMPEGSELTPRKAGFGFTFSNNSEGTANVTKVVLPTGDGITVDSNTCPTDGGIFAKNTSCTISGTYSNTGAQGQQPPVSATLQYTEGTDVVQTTQTNVTDVVVTGGVNDPLSDNMKELTTEDFSFRFTNSSTGAAKIKSHQWPKNGENGVSNVVSTCPADGNELAANTSCTVTGDYTAPKDASGAQPAITAELQYEQGEPVILSTATSVNNVVVQAWTNSPVVPGNTEVEKEYPFKFSFQNGDQGEATDISLTTPNIDPAKVQIAYKDGVNTCPVTLAKGAICVISGTITPQVTGALSIPFTFNYKEGDPLSRTINTTVGEVTLSGAVSPGDKLLVNEKSTYPITYTFKNESGSASADNLNVVLPAGMTDESTKPCTGTLGPGDSCEVLLNAKNITQITSLPVTLQFNGGEDVTKSVLLTPVKETSLVFGTFGDPTLAAPNNKSVLYVSASGQYDPTTGIRTGLTEHPQTTVTRLNDLTYTGTDIYGASYDGLQLCNGNDCQTLSPTFAEPSGRFIYPGSLVYSHGALWILDQGYSDHITQCTFASPSAANCKFVSVATGSISGGNSIRVYNNTLYYSSSNQIYACPISGDGASASLGACAVQYTGAYVYDMAFVNDPTFGSSVYIAESDVRHCKVAVDGSFSNCVDASNVGSGMTGVRFEPSHTFAYFWQDYGRAEVACKIDKATGDFVQDSCTNFTDKFPTIGPREQNKQAPASATYVG